MRLGCITRSAYLILLAGRVARRYGGVLAILLVALTLIAAPARADFAAGKAAYNAGNYDKALAEFLPLARQGNTAAQNHLGVMYREGRGVAKDEAEAARWFRKAADQGDDYGQTSLGLMFENGQGGAQDYAEAVRWYRKAADQGYSVAQANLGFMYERGRGVVRDDAQAVRWYRKAADQGYARGQTNLGVMYEKGRGVAKDEAEAVRWYREAADQGNQNAQTALARLEKEQTAAAEEARRREEEEEARRAARSSLTYCYRPEPRNEMFELRGPSCAPGAVEVPASDFRSWRSNKVAFLRSFERRPSVMAARGSNAAGVDAYDAGNYAKAYAELSPAALFGNAEAQTYLGLMYTMGRWVAQDFDEAVRWWRKAADQGYARAQHNLGVAYLSGRGVAQDDIEAGRWFRRAADQGAMRSQSSLGFIYENGRGVAQDYAEAVRWYRLAAEQGYTDARTALARLESQARQAEETRRAAEAEAERRRVAEEQARRAEETRKAAEAERRRVAEAQKLAEQEAERQRIASLTHGLAPADVVTAIVNNGVNLRVLPEASSDVVKQLAKGRQVQVTGVLPSGWLQVAEEGVPVGWIFKTAVAPDAFAAAPPEAPPVAARPAPVATAAENRDAVAVIIGNKAYTGDTPEVDYAHNDADAMKRYVIDVLGYREGNIIDLRDATLGQLQDVFGTDANPRGRLFDFVRPGESDVTVFYSGHGVPGLNDRRGYLLPIDGNPSKAENTAYSFDVLQANLAKLPARSVQVFLDACFSGNSAGGKLIQGISRGIGISPVLGGIPPNFVMLTAASGDQVASWDREAEHGLFTKHLLAALNGEADGERYGDGDGAVSLAEVEKYLGEMTFDAQRQWGRTQTADVVGDRSVVLSARPAPVAAAAQVELEPLDAPYRLTTAANVRAAPDVAADRVAGLAAGEEVTALGKVRGKDWYLVERDGERLGFVFGPLLAPVAAAPQIAAVAVPTRRAEEPQQAVVLEHRIALVVGNGNYQGQTPPLANPPNDARLMTAALKASGFEVIELIDADQRTMKTAISDFGARLEAAGEDGVGLFYYAGHGVQIGGRNFLIPVGANINREPDVDIEAVSAATVLGQMEFARNRLNFVILDSCRNNPYARSFRAVTRGLARMNASRGTLVAYATGPGEVAADGTGANSPYTLALVEAMAIPGLAVEQMFKRVRQTVIARTVEQQVPWESSSLTGDFFFNPAATPAVSATDAATARGPSETAELAFWNSIKDSDSPAAFEDYIMRFPDGLFATLAKIRLGEIRSQ